MSPPCIDDVGTVQYFSEAENNYLLLSVSQINGGPFLIFTPNINFGQWRAGCMVLLEDFYLAWHSLQLMEGRRILPVFKFLQTHNLMLLFLHCRVSFPFWGKARLINGIQM